MGATQAYGLDMNGDLQKLLDEIVARLEPLSLSRVVLFGSQAQEAATSESDIDLLVVLDREDVPQTHAEKMELELSVLRPLRGIREKHAMDVIIQTQATHRAFLAGDSTFAREIREKGIALYEAGHAPMA